MLLKVLAGSGGFMPVVFPRSVGDENTFCSLVLIAESRSEVAARRVRFSEPLLLLGAGGAVGDVTGLFVIVPGRCGRAARTVPLGSVTARISHRRGEAQIRGVSSRNPPLS